MGEAMIGAIPGIEPGTIFATIKSFTTLGSTEPAKREL